MVHQRLPRKRVPARACEKHRGGKSVPQTQAEEAQEFRQGWLDKKHKDFEQEKIYRKSFTRLDLTQGTFKPLGKVIVDEGGWSDNNAAMGSLRLAAQCIAMGPEFHMIHPQTGRQNISRVEFSWRERFQEAWEEFRQELGEAEKVQKDTAVGSAPGGVDALGNRRAASKSKGDKPGRKESGGSGITTASTGTTRAKSEHVASTAT